MTRLAEFGIVSPALNFNPKIGSNMKKTFIGLFVAAAMAFMSMAYADTGADGYTKTAMPSYDVVAYEKNTDQMPAAHVVGAKALTPVVRQYSVSYIAVGTASTAIACAGEDDHYKSIVAGRPSKIPIAM